MANGSSYELALYMRKLLVWRKGGTDPRYDSRVWRFDSYGRWMKFDEYGTTNSFGWELDHIIPVARGGGDQIANLQPLHWESNRAKSDSMTGLAALLLGRR